MKIFIISGSSSFNSYTSYNGEYLKDLLDANGCTTIHWDLCQRPLPLHNAAEYLNSSTSDVREFGRMAGEAQGMIWCTPIYHNSFSGILKNALDHLDISMVAHKPVLLVSNGGGYSGVTPCEQLRFVARGLYCVAIPTQLVTQSEHFTFVDNKKHLSDTTIKERFVNAANQLYDYCVKLQS